MELSSIVFYALVALSALVFFYSLVNILCKGQPKGLVWLALANTGERFGYYTMLAVFALFLGENFGFSTGTSSTIYSTFLMLVYFLPVIGGIAADRFGFGKMVTTGIFIMFIGYLLLAVPLGGNTMAACAMGLALILVSLGTGLFKGNLQVLVGKLYDAPEYAAMRDSGFSIFYMAINIGAMLAPTAAIGVMGLAQSQGVSVADSYHYAFAVACVSLIVSIIIYYASKRTFCHVLETEKKDVVVETSESTENTEKPEVPELSKAETKERIICLCLVFAVVIFFWMAFHQNGLTLTFFARDYVVTEATGLGSLMFNVANLWAVVCLVYGIYNYTRGEGTDKIISIVLGVLGVAILALSLCNIPASTAISAPIFQQFNPLFVVALTPVSVALFASLAKVGKEPSSPKKIGLGMLVAAIAFILMIVASLGLLAPEQQVATEGAGRVSYNWLVMTYLILTFAELLLSPIGISFVSKVAPPKYAGLMMGLWFASTAIGNFLVQIPGLLWGANVALPYIWGVLAGICLLSALFIFSILKKLEKVA